MITILYFIALLLGAEAPAPAAPVVELPEVVISPDLEGLSMAAFEGLGGLELIDEEAFVAGYSDLLKRGLSCEVLLLADMTRPSTDKRLFVIDLKLRRLIIRTYVAHGQATGELYAEEFSNKVGSHQSSKGLFRVGARIISPKHGDAFLLHGLDPGVNDRALEREIIIHGAPYVSEAFIKEHGRLGRSWGCPSVDKAVMPTLIQALKGRSLMYVHAS